MVSALGRLGVQQGVQQTAKYKAVQCCANCMTILWHKSNALAAALTVSHTLPAPARYRVLLLLLPLTSPSLSPSCLPSSLPPAPHRC